MPPLGVKYTTEMHCLEVLEATNLSCKTALVISEGCKGEHNL